MWQCHELLGQPTFWNICSFQLLIWLSPQPYEIEVFFPMLQIRTLRHRGIFILPVPSGIQGVIWMQVVCSLAHPSLCSISPSSSTLRGSRFFWISPPEFSTSLPLFCFLYFRPFLLLSVTGLLLSCPIVTLFSLNLHETFACFNAHCHQSW